MTDEKVSVRYMVDDVDAAVEFYTTDSASVSGYKAPAFAEVIAAICACCSRTDELRRTTDARRTPADAGRLEPDSLRR